ncbi:MAG: hypothetical protein A2Z83_09380 [Omnitrophica bacterium GWA2_52_8]|nr:MAG: hypothetical protein A2Z83_09380 [Omnitrophica bacterium GWA2_52_8]
MGALAFRLIIFPVKGDLYPFLKTFEPASGGALLPETHPPLEQLSAISPLPGNRGLKILPQA